MKLLHRLRSFRLSHDSFVFLAGGIPCALIFARGAADIILTLIVILFLLRCLTLRDWSWAKRPLHGVLLALWGWAIFISGPLSPHAAHAMEMAAISLRFPLFFIAMGHWVLRDARDVRYFAWFLGVTLLFMSVDMGVQWLTGHSLFNVYAQNERLSGSLHILDGGSYLARLWFPALGMFLWLSLRFCPRHVWTVAAVSALMVPWILLSGERSTTVVFLIALLAAGGLAFLGWRRGRPLIIALIALLAVGTDAVFVYSPFIHQRALLLKEQVENFAPTPYGQLWRGAWLMWRDYPATGVGVTGFRALCPILQAAGQVTYCDIHPHNHYLEWLAETGLIGLLLYLAFVVLLLKPLLEPESRILNPLLSACMLGAYVMNLFPLAVTQSLFSNWAATLQWFSLAAATALLRLYSNDATSLKG